MDYKFMVENIQICLLAEMKKIKDSEQSEYNKGQLNAYRNILGSMGVSNEYITLIIAGL